MGPLAFVLAACCVAGFPGRRKLLGFLAVLGGVAFLMSLGTAGGLAPLLFDLGLLRGLRFPARWFVYTQLFLAVAAGAGLDGWLYGRMTNAPDETGLDARPSRTWPAVGAAVLSFGAVATLLLLAATNPGLWSGRDPGRILAVTLAAALASAVLVAHRLRKRPSAGLAGVIVLLALTSSLAFVARDPLEAVPAAPLASSPRIAEGLAGQSGHGRTFTVAVDSSLLLAWTMSDTGWTPRTPALGRALLSGYGNLTAGVPMAGSATPLVNRERLRLFGAALAGGNMATLLGLVDVRHIITPYPTTAPGTRLVRRADGVSRYDLSFSAGPVFFPRGIRRVTDDEALAIMKRNDFDPEAVALVSSMPASPWSSLSPPNAPQARKYSVARVESDLPEEVRIATATSESGQMVITRSYDPGWLARVDETAVPVVRTDLSLMSLSVPAGEHRILLTYRPASFRYGCWLSVLSLVVLLGVVASGGPGR
jgi:hypothetical protein